MTPDINKNAAEHYARECREAQKIAQQFAVVARHEADRADRWRLAFGVALVAVCGLVLAVVQGVGG